jgi:hypothetical protein
LLEVSSRIARACLRRTFGALLVVSSEKPGAHTTPTSIPQASAAVSVPIKIVRQAAYIVNLSEFYSYRLIGKLTDFLQLQEFSLRRHTQVASSPFAVRLSSHSYRSK